MNELIKKSLPTIYDKLDTQRIEIEGLLFDQQRTLDSLSLKDSKAGDDLNSTIGRLTFAITSVEAAMEALDYIIE